MVTTISTSDKTTAIYKCDKCGNEQTTDHQFWTVGITAAHWPKQSLWAVEGKSIHVCRPCLESFGIHAMERDGVNPPPQLSVEDLVREIVAICSQRTI